jgi:hypothetical protein
LPSGELAGILSRRNTHGPALLQRHNSKPSSKGTGFVQPLAPHEHWHVDVSYLNIAGTSYYY